MSTPSPAPGTNNREAMQQEVVSPTQKKRERERDTDREIKRERDNAMHHEELCDGAAGEEPSDDLSQQADTECMDSDVQLAEGPHQADGDEA